MAKQVEAKTGEVIPVIRTWRNPPKTVGMKFEKNIIHHKAFAYDPEIRGLKVVDGDVEDREAYIQSFADECGVYNVLKKYSQTGDMSLLNQGQGFYGDISDIPADELDPAKVAAEASKALGGLNKLLGSELTAEQLASLSSEQISELINKAIAAQVAKAQAADVKKKGE